VRAALAVFMTGAALGAHGCSRADSALKQPKAINRVQYPVEVAPVVLRHVRYNVMAPGSIEAFQQVQITARVAGAVDRVAFAEGALVKQGDLLVVIEGERYEVAVGQAKAALAKAQANEKAAEAEFARRQGAVSEHPGLVPGTEISSYETAVATSKADVDAATQSLRIAEINRRDASVRAPFAGVVQSRTVLVGQYLQPGAVLATLLQRDPLLLRFPVTEQDAPRIKAGMLAQMTLRESARAYSAKIMLVAQAADPTTRLVPVTAEVDDTEHKYWLRPGAFCEVNVPVGEARDAVVVPTIAVQPTENGNVVYVVDDKNVAHAAGVALGMHTPEGGVEVTRGLKAGDLLVVRGFEPLSDGAPVKISERTTLESAEQSADAGEDAPGAPPTGDPASGAPPDGDPQAPPAAPAATAATAARDGGAHRRGGAAP
jgi:multidrug efflux system membrane fusion protein